jgi:hypothetical protein
VCVAAAAAAGIVVVAAVVVVAEVGGLHEPDEDRGRVWDPYWYWGNGEVVRIRSFFSSAEWLV